MVAGECGRNLSRIGCCGCGYGGVGLSGMMQGTCSHGEGNFELVCCMICFVLCSSFCVLCSLFCVLCVVFWGGSIRFGNE